MITGKLYDWLKWLAQVVLPGFGTLYFSLSGLWGLGGADAVVGTIMSVDLFLGLLLGISQVNYNKDVVSGVMNVNETDDAVTHTLEIPGGDLDKLPEKTEVRLKVVKK